LAIFNLLSGFKTYIAASCLLGLAIHHFASGMFGHGTQALLTGIVTCALRRAIAKLPS
jgi:hypothetical protein